MGTTLKRKKQLPLFRKVIKKKLLPIATFDVETQGMGGKLLDCCVTYGNSDYYHFNNTRDLVNWFLDHPGFRYYAHNGAGYDFTYIMDEIVWHKQYDGVEVEPIVQGETRIIGIILKRGKAKLELRDSLALIPMSLKKAAHIFAPDYEKLDINLAEHVYDPTDLTDIEYLHRDVDALYHVMVNFEQKIKEIYGTPIGFTAGSTAMYAWQAHIPDGHAYYRVRSDVEDFCRRGYYGGFVFPGKDTDVHTNALTIDRNAAFAKAMRLGVSTGNPIETDVFYPDRGGMYEVIAHVPKDCALPCIPSRDSKNNLRWCTGTFRTVITTQEILFARKHGCRVDVLFGYYWIRHEYPFDDFLDICEHVEKQLSVEDKEASKIQRNALYGKLGMKSHNKRVKLLDIDGIMPEQYPLIIEGAPLGEASPFLAFEIEENNANYIMPMWAAEITANARIALMEIFLAIGMENVFYGDTDSCTFFADTDPTTGKHRTLEKVVESGLITISRNYGDVKIEKEWVTFQSLGPKNYHGILTSGQYVGKAKGIPSRVLTEWKMLMYQMNSFEEPPEFEFDSSLSAFMKLKYPDKSIAQPRKRKLSTLANSASWKQIGTRIYPLHVEEVMLHSE